jgi:alpha-1,3/alpha-1,6-mannosyltransferase
VRFHVPDASPVPEFPEVSGGAVPVERVRTWLPEHIGGRFRAPMAIARTAAAARALARSTPLPDVIFCDVVSHVVPLVKRLTERPVLFFCHFPDVLLTPEASRASPAYRIYRRRLDRNEEEGLRAADRVIVNSAFTAAKVTEVFPGLGRTLTVVHPGVPMETVPQAPIPNVGDIVLLSVSRFDPRKNLELAIEAMAALRSRVSPDVFGRVRLVMAGGYDESLPGQVAVLQGLRDRAAALGVSKQVRFVLTPESEERDRLLAGCRAVLYTPVAEHFGIVPLEAMAAGRPVVAVNHGGPTETVTHDRTGFLCPPDPQAFAGVLATLVTRLDVAEQIGSAARDDVRRRFSIDAFGDRLWKIVEPMLPGPES